MNLGYSDAFVHSTASGVEVIVIANESSATAALDIINIIHETLDKTESVVVNLMPFHNLNLLKFDATRYLYIYYNFHHNAFLR